MIEPATRFHYNAPVKEHASFHGGHERVLLSFYPDVDTEARNVAKKLLSVAIDSTTPVDWAEVERLTVLPGFAVTRELEELRNEVERG